MFQHSSCDKSEGWQELSRRAQFSDFVIAKLFDQEEHRVDELSACCEDMLLDLSRQSFDSATWQALCKFARSRSLEEGLQSWFYGQKVNTSEDRAAIHQMYRHKPDSLGSFSAKSWQQACWDSSGYAEMQRMRNYASKLREGSWLGSTGKPINCLINVGVGGSHLGIELVYQALAPWHILGISCVFVANIDPHACEQALEGLDLSRCALVMCSKSATTLESQRNFASITKAYASRGISNLAPHLFGVTANRDKLALLGIVPEQIFTIPKSIGGRYSLWSPVAFVIECCIKPEAISAMLKGAAIMDQHTLEAPITRNLPIMLALTSLWHHGLRGVQQHAIFAYSYALRGLVPHLQQLIMESNGKRVTINGDLASSTGEIIWGGECSNAEHSCFQLLHQGNQPLNCDLVVVAQSLGGKQSQQDELLGMCLGQSHALTFGNRSDEAMRLSCGNIPISILLCKQLDARTVGMLLVLYENRTIAHAILLGINPFDQWGVEFGKDNAGVFAELLQKNQLPDTLDPSTCHLLRTMQRWKA